LIIFYVFSLLLLFFLYQTVIPVSKKSFETLQQHWSNVSTLLQCCWNVPI